MRAIERTNAVQKSQLAVQVTRLSHGSRLTFDRESSSVAAANLAIVVCDASSTIEIAGGMPALICPIFDSAAVSAGEMRIRLARSDVYVSDTNYDHSCVVSPHGTCLLVVGSARAWDALFREFSPEMRVGPLYPCVHRQASATRFLLQLTRRWLRDESSRNEARSRLELFNIVGDLQSRFAPLIERCPGSKSSRKRSVFIRLQRIGNYIEACAHRNLDVGKLALMANYSVSHFITIFRQVFLETPYSAISRHRVENARALLAQSTLPIADIAQTIGYPSRTAFARALRQRLGASPTGIRAEARQ